MVCPFVNGDDCRCAEHLNLDTIDFAVAVCGDEFTGCEIFWERMAALREGQPAHTTAA